MICADRVPPMGSLSTSPDGASAALFGSLAIGGAAGGSKAACAARTSAPRPVSRIFRPDDDHSVLIAYRLYPNIDCAMLCQLHEERLLICFRLGQADPEGAVHEKSKFGQLDAIRPDTSTSFSRSLLVVEHTKRQERCASDCTTDCLISRRISRSSSGSTKPNSRWCEGITRK